MQIVKDYKAMLGEMGLEQIEIDQRLETLKEKIAKRFQIDQADIIWSFEKQHGRKRAPKVGDDIVYYFLLEEPKTS